jgi:DNA-binding IclR family transcriptional regulator
MLTLGMLIPVNGEKMRPGLPVLRLGHSALTGLDALELARPHMQDLADRYGAACSLSTRDGLNMVFLERCESSNQLLMNLRRGSVVPMATSSSGWAYLAGNPNDARAKLIAEIQANDPERWNSVSKHFNQALVEYGAKGYVLNEGVFHVASNTIATPVFGAESKIVYCLTCGSASATLSATALRKEVAPKLVALARMLETVTGSY